MEQAKKVIISKLKDTYCRLMTSRIEGIGIFAIRDIPKGINPFKGIHNDNWVEFNIDELKDLDKEILKMIDDFFVIENNGTVLIPDHGLNGMNISFFLNHSDKPNVKRFDDEGEFITLREIKKGEELTVSYGTFDYKY